MSRVTLKLKHPITEFELDVDENSLQLLWIPVTEQLPDIQCNVLCDDEGRVVVGYYTDEEVGWHDMHSYKIYPTHWMPLPQPPEKENK